MIDVHAEVEKIERECEKRREKGHTNHTTHMMPPNIAISVRDHLIRKYKVQLVPCMSDPPHPRAPEPMSKLTISWDL